MTQNKDFTHLIESFLKKHYSDNSNDKIAAHINILINVECEEGHPQEITPRIVQSYATRLGLRKSHEYNTGKVRENNKMNRSVDTDAEIAFFNGNPTLTVRSTDRKKGKQIICASRKQMNIIKNAAYRFNIRERESTGIHLKVHCDTEKLTVFLKPYSISLPDSCRNRFSPAEGLCVPP